MRRSFWPVPVIVTIALVLALVGYYLNTRRGASLLSPSGAAMATNLAQPPTSMMALSSASASAKPIQPSVSPTQVTDSYYKAYIACLQKGTNAQTCMTQTPYTSSDFAQNIAGKAAGTDPVLCAQNTPQSATVGRESIMGNIATTYVSESFGAPPPRQILINLSSDTGNWRITDIACPKP